MGAPWTDSPGSSPGPRLLSTLISIHPRPYLSTPRRALDALPLSHDHVRANRDVSRGSRRGSRDRQLSPRMRELSQTVQDQVLRLERILQRQVKLSYEYHIMLIIDCSNSFQRLHRADR